MTCYIIYQFKDKTLAVSASFTSRQEACSLNADLSSSLCTLNLLHFKQVFTRFRLPWLINFLALRDREVFKANFIAVEFSQDDFPHWEWPMLKDMLLKKRLCTKIFHQAHSFRLFHTASHQQARTVEAPVVAISGWRSLKLDILGHRLREVGL